MQCRKKPVVVNALQWTGENCDAMLGFLMQTAGTSTTKTIVTFDLTVKPVLLRIHTLENTSDPLTASIGDWVIVGVKNEVYPCKPDIFAETYELVAAQKDGA